MKYDILSTGFTSAWVKLFRLNSLTRSVFNCIVKALNDFINFKTSKTQIQLYTVDIKSLHFYKVYTQFYSALSCEIVYIFSTFPSEPWPRSTKFKNKNMQRVIQNALKEAVR